jgi:hypothetical protein
MSAAEPGDPQAFALPSPAPAGTADWKSSTAAGVAFTLTTPAGQTNPAALLLATNAGQVPRRAAWLRLDKSFAPPLNLKDRQALGFDVEGDGSGALLALRLESPRHTSFGALADRYLPLDFIGRRFVTLVETESTRWSDYTWNDGKSLYNAYRETMDFAAVEALSVWLQNLPPDRATQCRVGPLYALPLRAGRLKDPRLTVAGKTLEFPVELPSGSWLEARGPEDCAAYGPKGEPLGKITPRGAWPQLPVGAAPLQFAAQPAGPPAARARVTIFTHGDDL